MRIVYITLLAMLAATFLQIGGCHYYVRATPEVVFSSERIERPLP